MVNPNPARITAQLWWFWEQLHKLEPTSQLGGIYANKPGYHKTRAANLPTNYSVQYTLDKLGPSDKAAAVDWTFPEAQSGNYGRIAKYSKRLLDSGKDLDDSRGNFLREFYGNADTDTQVEGWDFQRVSPATSDSSHLWHIHFSFMRYYVDNQDAVEAVLSILKGESVDEWSGDVLTDADVEKIARRVWLIDMIPNPDPDSDKTVNPTWQPDNALHWAARNAYEANKALKTLPPAIDYEKLAAAFVAKLAASGLPVGGLTVDEVKQAVKDALREGTSQS